MTEVSHWVQNLSGQEKISDIESAKDKLNKHFIAPSSNSISVIKATMKGLLEAGGLTAEKKAAIIANLFHDDVVVKTIRGGIKRNEFLVSFNQAKDAEKIIRVTKVGRLTGPAMFVLDFNQFVNKSVVALDSADEHDLEVLSREEPFFRAVEIFDPEGLKVALTYAEKSILEELEIARKLNDKLDELLSAHKILKVEVSVTNSGKRSVTISPYAALKIATTGKDMEPILLTRVTNKEGGRQDAYATVKGDDSSVIAFQATKSIPSVSSLIKTEALGCQLLLENTQDSLFSRKYIKSDLRTFGANAIKELSSSMLKQF